MNKSFKVVFNKARGALMVVNEVTSSVQAKGTKTVIATAVALVAGAAVAAPEISTTPDVDTTVSEWGEVPAEGVITTDKKIDWADVKADGQYHYKNNAGQSAFTTLTKEKGEFAGKLWVSASGKDADATGLEVKGEGVELTNKGEIYVTTDKDGVEWKNEAILAEDNAKAVNAGKIVVKNAYGMRVGRNAPATIENAGTIIVEEQGVGMELGGGAKSVGSVATNNGSIIVGDIAEGKYGHGVLIKDAKDVVLNNNGLIQAGEGATAIDVQLEGETSATINLGETSQIDGLIKIGEGTKVALNAKGMTGKLKVQAADSTTTFNVAEGSTVELVDGQKSVYEKVNVEKGTLTASIQKADNHMKDVVVGEEGVFNITKLNSGGNQDDLAAKPHDTLLLSAMDVTLNGGDLQVAGQTYEGKVKIGVSKVASQLTVNKGAYRFDDVSFGSSFKEPNKKRSVLEVAAGGTLSVGTLDFSNGDVQIGGQLNADKLVWEDKQYGNETTHVSGPEGTITVNAEGVLTTVAKDNLAKQDEAGKWTTTEVVEHITNNGTLEITDAFSAKASDVKDYLAKAESAFGGEVVFKNVTLTDEKVEWAPELGMITLNTTVALPEADDQGVASAQLDGNDVGVAALEVAEGTKSVKVEGTGSLTVRGEAASGNVFEGVSALETAEVSNLVLGYEDADTGVVNAKTLKAGALDVIGSFTAQNVEVGSVYVDGALALNCLTVTGEAKIENGTLNLLGVTEKDAKDIAGKVTVTGAGLLTTHKAAADAYIAKLEDEEQPAVFYVDRGVKLADSAEIVIGSVATQKIALLASGEGDADSSANNATVKFVNGGYGLVDVTKFLDTEEAVFGENADVVVENGAAIDLVNVTKTSEVKLGASVNVAEGGEIDTDSLYLGAQAGDKGVVAINYRDGVAADDKVDARLKDLFTKGASEKEVAILNALDNELYLDPETDTLNALGNKALEQATGGNATAGVLNVAYDANAQVTDAIVRHQLSAHAGMGVWADVFYAKNEAKKLYGDFGYSADIYGGVLGFDYTAACGGTLGAALTVGTADADSEGGVLSNSLSSDFVGFSVYASKDFSGLNVKADLGYIDFSNDFSGLGDASDASTITFDVRGDFTAYQNGAFSVVPHMGLRYTRIDTDAVAFNDEQNMNVLEAPIGVKFAGTFETAGWKVVPSYDFTIVPQLGDKDVEAFGTAGDVTILSGGLYNNVIGVEAVNGNLSFGLNASYGFGPDDRANTQVNANIRYNF